MIPRTFESDVLTQNKSIAKLVELMIRKRMNGITNLIHKANHRNYESQYRRTKALHFSKILEQCPGDLSAGDVSRTQTYCLGLVKIIIRLNLENSVV